jgi:hypothetical protein
MATQIQSSLHSTFADLQWVVDAYALTLAALLLTSGSHAHAMLDLSLFKVPTFSGGNIAGFAMSAGSFSAFLYLVLYLQDVLRYSPLQTGVRLLLLSGAVSLAPLSSNFCPGGHRQAGADSDRTSRTLKNTRTGGAATEARASGWVSA